MKTAKLAMGVLTVAGLAGVAAMGMVGFGERPAAAGLGAGAYEIDPVHSSAIFKIKHESVSNFYGRFNDVSGTFTFDTSSPESASFEVTIKTESVNSGQPARDGHLRKSDFFNAGEHPKITFKSTGVKKVGDKFEVTGDLTMLGKTKPITATVVHTGEKTTPRGEKAGVEATFTVKRSEFGMNYGIANGGLGDEVGMIVALEGTKK